MDATAIFDFIFEWWLVILIALGILIYFIIKRRRKSKLKREPVDDTLNQHPQHYDKPIQPEQPRIMPVHDYYGEPIAEYPWEAEKPIKESKPKSFEETTESALKFIETYMGSLDKELKSKAEVMKKEDKKVSQILDNINKMMNKLGNYREDLKDKKKILVYNINAVEGARTVLSSDAPETTRYCSACHSKLTPYKQGYVCPVHGLIK